MLFDCESLYVACASRSTAGPGIWYEQTVRWSPTVDSIDLLHAVPSLQ